MMPGLGLYAPPNFSSIALISSYPWLRLPPINCSTPQRMSPWSKTLLARPPGRPPSDTTPTEKRPMNEPSNGNTEPGQFRHEVERSIHSVKVRCKEKTNQKQQQCRRDGYD